MRYITRVNSTNISTFLVLKDAASDLSQKSHTEYGRSPCGEAMFMSSDTEKIRKAAHLACMAQYAFQRNWFPDPIGTITIWFEIAPLDGNRLKVNWIYDFVTQVLPSIKGCGSVRMKFKLQWDTWWAMILNFFLHQSWPFFLSNLEWHGWFLAGF